VIEKLFNNKKTTIASAAFILGAASLISRLLGLLRDRVLAGKFGAGNDLDIYYAAFRIPDLVYSILVLGALSAGFIPVFVSYLKKKDNYASAWYLANSVLNLIVLSLIGVCLLLIIFAPYLVKLIAPGFSLDKLESTAQLTRIMFLSPLFLGLSAVFGSILQSFRRFFFYSLGPIMYNLGIIFGALFLTDYFGLLGLAYGVVLGAFLHMLIQLPSVFLCGFRWRPYFDLKFAGVRRIFKMMPPRVLSLIFYQITFWAMTLIASFLAVGSVAVYNLAYNIWSFPLGIFAVSLVIAAFPKLSEYAQEKKRKEFAQVFYSTFRQILFFALPSAALFIILRWQIVKVILGTGCFSPEDISLTAQTLAYFSLGLFAESLILLFLRGFFAWEDAKTPFLISLVATFFRVAAAWYFAQSMGAPGLALGFSLGGFVYLGLLLIALRKKIQASFLKQEILNPSGKILLASSLAALAAYFVLIWTSFADNFSGNLSQGILAGMLGGLVYFFFSWIFKIKEFKILFKHWLKHE